MLQNSDMRREFARELEHWSGAAARLANLDAIAPMQAWQALEHYLGVALRQTLTTVVTRLRQTIERISRELNGSTEVRIDEMSVRMLEVRKSYLRAETTVDFYADALATRSIPHMAALLRACDHIATRSMAEALAPMGREVPATLSYINSGLGASILKAGLRLWDGTVDNPVATIKVTRHNLLRPSALIHEAGHQVAHMLGWTPELAHALRTGLKSRELGALWSSWASEIAADAFAHVHTGFAAVVALHDVLDGKDEAVFQILPGDPHPVAFLRVLMANQMCVRSFGTGPWQRLAETWIAKHRIERAPKDIRAVLHASMQALPRIVELVLYAPYRAFGGRPISALINPARVSPHALAQLERDSGASAFTSPYWAWNEAIRLLALTGSQAGLGPSELRRAVAQQEAWMLRLGDVRRAA